VLLFLKAATSGVVLVGAVGHGFWAGGVPSRLAISRRCLCNAEGAANKGGARAPDASECKWAVGAKAVDLAAGILCWVTAAEALSGTRDGRDPAVVGTVVGMLFACALSDVYGSVLFGYVGWLCTVAWYGDGDRKRRRHRHRGEEKAGDSSSGDDSGSGSGSDESDSDSDSGSESDSDSGSEATSEGSRTPLKPSPEKAPKYRGGIGAAADLGPSMRWADPAYVAQATARQPLTQQKPAPPPGGAPAPAPAPAPGPAALLERPTVTAARYEAMWAQLPASAPLVIVIEKALAIDDMVYYLRQRRFFSIASGVAEGQCKVYACATRAQDHQVALLALILTDGNRLSVELRSRVDVGGFAALLELRKLTGAYANS